MPSYHLMAVVALSIVALTFPLVYLQRRLLRTAGRFAVIGGKGQAFRPLPLGALRWPAVLLLVLWLAVTVLLPLVGVALRSLVSSWGEGVKLTEVLTLDHFRELTGYPNLVRGIVNTLLIGAIGGALSVAFYAIVGLAAHRWQSRWVSFLDYLVMLPRALPGLIVGLAFLLGISLLQTDRAAAHDFVQLVDRLHRGLARLWPALDFGESAASQT